MISENCNVQNAQFQQKRSERHTRHTKAYKETGIYGPFTGKKIIEIIPEEA